MHLPLRLWKHTLALCAYVGLVSNRLNSPLKSPSRSRKLIVEPLEGRAMLTEVSPPVVSIESTDNEAREVGSEPAEFSVSRTSENTSGPLTVYYGIGGTATNGSDYNPIQYAITIPSGASSVTFLITPVMDTTIEGIETVVITLSSSPGYTLSEYTSAFVNIRDRAGVKQILATYGVTGIPEGGPGRDVTGAHLILTQGDTVVFHVVPTDGGDFAPDEPTWAVTGDAASTGEWRFQTFGIYRDPGATILSVSTPANTSPKTATITLVPYPTAVVNTRAVGTVYLTDQYGTDYEFALSPSSGASDTALYVANSDSVGYLLIEEIVTVEQPYDYSDFELTGPIRLPGTIFLEGIPQKAILKDKKAVGTHQVFPYNGFLPSGETLTLLQDLRWKSTAPDSINAAPASAIDQGWHDFATDMAITYNLASSANGWTVTTAVNDVSFVQPHRAPESVAHLMMPLTIPAGGIITPLLYGTVLLSAADVAAGTKTFTLTLYDYDYGTDPALSSASLTVPAANGVAGMYTPFFINSAYLWNSNHIVVGALGSSDEQEADVYFVTPGGANSETLQIFAE